MENIDWKNLSFDYRKTNCHIQAVYNNGEWGKPEAVTDDKLTISIASTCLHYGQTCFEGLKAFRGKDNKIRIFRWRENAKRMAKASERIMMAKVPEELFGEAVKMAVEKNQKFVPPYDSGATLYIRPLLIGTTSYIKVHPATEYIFLVLVSPVGPYFKGGFSAMDVVIEGKYDRAAAQGTGQIKMGGNYAAGMLPLNNAAKGGFGTAIFLDAREKKYIDECGQANFFAVKGNKYITPESTSILDSITNKSLQTIAKDLGMEVEVRPIAVSELGDFDEAGACGTAAVITPIKRIVDKENNKNYEYKNAPGEKLKKLYDTLRAIQYGDMEDKYNWITIL